MKMGCKEDLAQKSHTELIHEIIHEYNYSEFLNSYMKSFMNLYMNSRLYAFKIKNLSMRSHSMREAKTDAGYVGTWLCG